MLFFWWPNIKLFNLNSFISTEEIPCEICSMHITQVHQIYPIRIYFFCRQNSLSHLQVLGLAVKVESLVGGCELEPQKARI
jgi:hypothetical protein